MEKSPENTCVRLYFKTISVNLIKDYSKVSIPSQAFPCEFRENFQYHSMVDLIKRHVISVIHHGMITLILLSSDTCLEPYPTYLMGTIFAKKLHHRSLIGF